MKPVIVKVLDTTPIIVAVAIVAYIIEEITEDLYSEALSDFVYPIAGLVILAILWRKIIPTIRTYLSEDASSHLKNTK